MDKEKLIQRLMETFLGELEEHTRALNEGLLALEKGPAELERASMPFGIVVRFGTQPDRM